MRSSHHSQVGPTIDSYASPLIVLQFTSNCVALRPAAASRFSATGSGGPGWWPVDATIHARAFHPPLASQQHPTERLGPQVHGEDLVILAVNPERFPVNSVVFDLSDQNIVDNSTCT